MAHVHVAFVVNKGISASHKHLTTSQDFLTTLQMLIEQQQEIREGGREGESDRTN